mmetsp:Transcript_34615/g.35299  ORF Transcript_34615/g.35299 Transcript_34615/m.35299 type:complete len:176 (+) Transcript_34615:191-718(+)
MTSASVYVVERKKKHLDSSPVEADIFRAVRDGDAAVVNDLLVSGYNVNKSRWSGWTLLHRAAENGHSHICEILIDKGAHIDERSGWGWLTPLHLALSNGFVDTALLLFSNGANPDLTNKYKETPVDFARRKGLNDVALEFEAEVFRISTMRESQLMTSSPKSFVENISHPNSLET